MNGSERLHKRIAASGLCSRRAAEKLIDEGRVTVNGKLVVEMGFKVGDEDQIRVDGQLIEEPKLYYLAMNKPKGYLTTLRDPEGRKTVVELLPQLPTMLKPVGRLDMDTEGLLLFTNDGRLAQRLMHPRYLIDKEYQVTVRGVPDGKKLDKLSAGIWLQEGGKTAPAKIDRVFADEKKDRCSFRITIHEGRKRQVRNMCLAIGHPVKELKRVRVGPIQLDGMPKGVSRMLSRPELEAIFEAVNLKLEPLPAKRGHRRKEPKQD